MIKNFYWLLLGCILIFTTGYVNAQNTSDEGSAVKLGSGANIINTIIWGNKGKQWSMTGDTSHVYIQGLPAYKGVKGSILFQDSLAGDFRLKGESPCINAGKNDVSSLLGPLDLWGNKRTSPTIIDIGAYEYQLYQIKFLKNKEVVIEQITGDSTGVVPGGTYAFKVNADFAGLDEKSVIVKVVGEEEKKIEPDQNGLYTLEHVNSDMTIKIILTPPITVTVVKADHGTLTVKDEKGQVVPNGSQMGIVVQENEKILLDTIDTEEGYYCKDVWMRLAKDAETAWTSIKDKVGVDKGYIVTENMYCKAEYAPHVYPLILKVNDRTRGSLEITSNETPVRSYSVAEGSNEYNGTVEYDKNLKFTVVATAATGYTLASIKVYDTDGVSGERGLSNNTQAVLRIGGIQIVAEFIPEEYYVKWNCVDGDLDITGGGTREVNTAEGGYRVKVDYGTMITITSKANEGYEYKANSLTATPEGGTATAIADADSKWKVEKTTVLNAEFQKKQYDVTITQQGLEVSATGYYSVTTGTITGGKVEHGSNLILQAEAPTGYECKQIKLNGILQTGTFVTIADIKGAQTVEFIFERSSYTVAFTNNSAEVYGVLQVEKQTMGTTGWAAFSESPGTAWYKDKIKVTVTPKTGYKLKSLTVNGVDETTAVGGESGGNKEFTIEQNYTIVAEFEPKQYTVTIVKDQSSSGSMPDKGKITLKEGSKTLVLDYTENGPKQMLLVNYDTQINLEFEFIENYGLTELMEKVEGETAQSILGNSTFKVTGNTTLTATIKQTKATYAIHWVVDTPDEESSSDFRVEKPGGNAITEGEAVAVSTQLSLLPTPDTRDMLWSITNQNGNEVTSPYMVSGPVTFTVKFVRKCTLEIQNLTDAVIKVRTKTEVPLPDGTKIAAGTELADGAVIPAGIELEAMMTSVRPVVCEKLMADGTDLAKPEITPTAIPPVSIAWKEYKVPESPVNDEVVFSGQTRKYYQVKYKRADFGEFYVNREGNKLSAGQTYYYPENTEVQVVARTTVEGYELASPHYYNNSDRIALLPLFGESNGWGAIHKLTGDAEFSVKFKIKTYKVVLEVLLPQDKALADVGSVELKDGTNTLTDKGDFMTEYKKDLIFSGTAKSGYVLQLAENAVVQKVGQSSVTWTKKEVSSEVRLTARFIQLYQVDYDASIAWVKRADGTTLASGDYAYAGELLKASSVIPALEGQECKKLMVRKGRDENEDVIAPSTATRQDGTIQCGFNMPAEDVKVKAEFGLKTYDLTCKLEGVTEGSTLTVVKTAAGGDSPVTPGKDRLDYGDQLKLEVLLSPVTAGSTETWYEVESISGIMGDGSITFGTPVQVDNKVTYDLTGSQKVVGDVLITVRLKRKTCNVNIKLDPLHVGGIVELAIGDNTPQDYTVNQKIAVPMGEKVTARVKTGSLAEGYELSFFPQSGGIAAPFIMDKVVSDLYLTAKFELKKFPLTILCDPSAGGHVVIRDNAGGAYSDQGGTYQVQYGLQLASVSVTPSSSYYQLTGITAMMNGVDQFEGQEDGNWQVSQVTGGIAVKASFERIYRILMSNAVVLGTLEVLEGDGSLAADAVGNYYAEGQLLTAKVTLPDDSYECKGVTITFPGTALNTLNLIPDAEGKVTYQIPAGCTAEDIVFGVDIVKKTYQVTLKKLPVDGGDASVWLGDRTTGHLLLELTKNATDTLVVRTDVEHGSVLNLYTTANAPDFELVSKSVEGNVYTGPVTLTQNTVFEVRFGRLYTLTIGPNVIVKSADGGKVYTNGERVPEGLQLTAKAELTGHDCSSLVATKDGATYHNWNDTDGDGIIEETFYMPAGNVDIRGTFLPKKFKVSIDHQPDMRAFDNIDVYVEPGGGASDFKVDREKGSLAEYLSALRLDLATLQLHPWYEGPVTVTAVMHGDPTVYDLQSSRIVVKDSVKITAKAHRKNKQLNVIIQQETGADGNQVVVQTENGAQQIFTANGSITVDVGAPVEIWTMDAEGCKTVLLSADDGVTKPVTNAPFTLSLVNMPDADVTVTAHFGLKRYPVYYTANTGGNIVVNKTFNGFAEGVVVNSGDEVKHFTTLSIKAEPINKSYQLKKGGLTVTMGNVTVNDPEHIASVTGPVMIQADFERLYEVKVVQPAQTKGNLAIQRADTNAVGHRYPAGTELKVKAQPQTGYEISGITLNGYPLNGMPKEGGEIICVIPDEPQRDSVEFEVDYTLKKYKVKFIVEGSGTANITGLPGGDFSVNGTGQDVVSKERTVEHFTRLGVGALCQDPYLLTKLDFHQGDGNVISLIHSANSMQHDTVWEVSGDLSVEIRFSKYYWVVYNTPEHAKMTVNAGNGNVKYGERFPGLTAFDIRLLPDEGYEIDYLKANGEDVVNHSFLLPQEDAAYDTLRIEGQCKLKTQQLTVIQPDNGYITVEKKNSSGDWEMLDVSVPLILEYWTEIRVKAGVHNETGYLVTDLTVNGTSVQSGDSWVVKSDCLVEAVVSPRMYSVTYQHPKKGRFHIVTSEGTEITSGMSVAYGTVLQVSVVLNDPEGYHLEMLEGNGMPIENDSHWTVVENTVFSGSIQINRWEITSQVKGEGKLYLMDWRDMAIDSPTDTVDHYTVLRVEPRAEEGWMLYALDIYGAELNTDSTLVVNEEVMVVATFKEREPYRFPAVFTPNGDGFNDAFVIAGLWQAPENKLEVFDRDQKKVYKASPYNNEWDGKTDNGHILPAGNYVYKFTLPDGKEYIGMVSIVRN